LRFNKDGMIAVFAPMGAGKGVGVVIPNLLDYRGSIVCTDIKGENSATTRHQRETLGKVRILDTTDPLRSDHFNPLDMIRTGSFHERDDAEALARLMIIPDDKTSHWDAKTEGLLACLILHVMRLEPEQRRPVSKAPGNASVIAVPEADAFPSASGEGHFDARGMEALGGDAYSQLRSRQPGRRSRLAL
jgi:type IV secretion system protein VirD4